MDDEYYIQREIKNAELCRCWWTAVKYAFWLAVAARVIGII